MEIDETQLGKDGKELVIFGSRDADGRAAENGVVAKHETGGLKHERAGVRIRLSRIVKVGPIGCADARFERALDDNFRICGNFEVDGLAPDELHALLFEAAREIIFIEANRAGSAGRHHHGFTHADRNRHLQQAALFLGFCNVQAEVAGGRSADSRLLRAKDLHPVDAYIADAGFRVPRYIEMPCANVAAGILWTPLRNRQAKEIDIACRNNVLLNRTGFHQGWGQWIPGSILDFCDDLLPALPRFDAHGKADQSHIAQAIGENAVAG